MFLLTLLDEIISQIASIPKTKSNTIAIIYLLVKGNLTLFVFHMLKRLGIQHGQLLGILFIFVTYPVIHQLPYLVTLLHLKTPYSTHINYLTPHDNPIEYKSEQACFLFCCIENDLKITLK